MPGTLCGVPACLADRPRQYYVNMGKNFHAQQAESPNRSLRSQGSQSTTKDIATARALDTEEELRQ